MGRIIYADDDAIVGELVSKTLLSAGHAVGWLDNGKSAFDIMSLRPPDLAILDYNMPEMSGMEVLRTMRRLHQLSVTPVLMLTGRRSESDEKLLRYEGANDYLRKPFDLTVLIERAEALLRGERRLFN